MPTRLQNVWYKTTSNYFMKDLGNDLYKSLKVEKKRRHKSGDGTLIQIAIYGYTLNLADYLVGSAECQDKYLKPFGIESLEKIKDFYPEEWKSVLAECIAQKVTKTQGKTLDFEERPIAAFDTDITCICPSCAARMGIPALMVSGLKAEGKECDVEICHNKAIYVLDIHNIT